MVPNGMLNCLTPLAHFLRMLIKAALHGVNQMFMLPTRDTSLLACGAFVPDGATLADVGPVPAQNQAIFLVRVAIGQRLAGRTNLHVRFGNAAEVLLSKPTFGLDA